VLRSLAHFKDLDFVSCYGKLFPSFVLSSIQSVFI
jgi:hypothetical protein